MKVLVTGGSGFLGKRIVEELLINPELVEVTGIRIYDLVPYEGISDDRISAIQGDIRDAKMVDEACKGMDYVIHAASIVDWGSQSDEQVHNINVGGTRNVIDACLKHQIKGLIYTSSLDVVFSGKHLRDINERIPYPEKYMTMYCQSKYEAEKLVLEANGDQLKTCALRPSDVWGEADPYHIDSLIEVAKSGFYVRIGDGSSKCQHVYVGNCAFGHVQALKAMTEGSHSILGSAYFLTDGEGSNFFKFFDPILIQSGVKLWPKNLWLPGPVAYAMGSISEAIAYVLRPIKFYNPKFSRFAVTYTTSDFTFSSKKAIEDFGFKVKYAHDLAVERTVNHYRSKLS